MSCEWPIKSLAEFADINPMRIIKRGVTAPFVSMGALDFSRDIDTSAVALRAFEGSGSRFKNGDTLLARITPSLENGKTALVSGFENEQICHGSTEFIVLGPRSTSDALFLYYLARSPEFREHAIQSMEGTTGRQRVPARAVAEYNFKCPPRQDRTAIGEVLGRIDDRIALLKEMNFTLESIAQAIFNSWFIDFDPVHAKAAGLVPEGMDAETAASFPGEFEDSELGSIPKGWRVRVVKDIGTVVTGKTPPTREPKFYGSDIPFITIPDMHNSIFVTNTERMLSSLGASTQRSKMLPPMSVSVSCIATTGLVSLVAKPSQTNQQINSIICNSDISPYYIYFYMKQLKEYLMMLGSGGSATLNINKGQFESIPLLIPTLVLMKGFSQTVESLFDRILNNIKLVQTLASLRDTLLPRLISGKLRVPEAEEIVEEAIS